MVHSIELLLDQDTETLVRRQWQDLAEAGLPSEFTAGNSPQRRPHVTLIACRLIEPGQLRAAGETVAEALPLAAVLGAPMIFGSARARRPGLILVRQLPASRQLLALQQQVMDRCPPPVDRNFAAGHWTPHVTLARRLAPDQVGHALRVLGTSAKGSRPEIEARLTGCRSWRGDLKQARLLAGNRTS